MFEQTAIKQSHRVLPACFSLEIWSIFGLFKITNLPSVVASKQTGEPHYKRKQPHATWIWIEGNLVHVQRHARELERLVVTTQLSIYECVRPLDRKQLWKHQRYCELHVIWFFIVVKKGST